MRKPTQKQRIFVDEILKGASLSDAYRKAYSTKNMSDKSIWNEAQRLKKNPIVAPLLEKKKIERQERTNFDADKVLAWLSDCMNADPIDIYDSETKCFKPLDEWPAHWRKMLIGIDNRELFANEAKIGDIVKFKFIDKMRAIENIGKHISVNAFKEIVDHNHKIELQDDELDARIKELESRLKA